MKILAVGDIFGRPGREIIKKFLPDLIEKHSIDFVVVNGENAAHGKGITPKIVKEFFLLPIDVITAGNHIWEHESLYPYFESHPILRPINIKKLLPGRGYIIKTVKNKRIAVISLQGQIYMDNKGPDVSNPFHYMEAFLDTFKGKSDIIIIDFHAEATSEKRALAWFLDGKVNLFFGTHTHVQTADEQIMPKGMAYISDIGMTGPHESVIGLDIDLAVNRFLTGEKKKFKVAEQGVFLEGIIVDIDEGNGRAISIERIQEKQ